MNTRKLAIFLTLISLSACNSNTSRYEPPEDASASFAKAINSQDIEAAMAHWSDDALLYFMSGDEVSTVVPRDAIQENYEHMFSDEHAPTMQIRVDGTERFDDIIHEWGSYKIGESTGCYVLMRRAVDGWKIHREWLVEPCKH